MFGYVRIYKPECRFREYEYYRGVYCGVCRALRKCGGACARLTLSYDAAFLALVRMALEGETPRFVKKRCPAHPLRRHTEALPTAAAELSARMSLILTYYKNKDDRRDEKGRKRLRARLLSPALGRMSRRAAKGCEALEPRIKESLEALWAFEAAPTLSLDRPAVLFGETLGEILSFGLAGEKEKIARAIGRAIGKWVYLADALDDREEDLRLGRYNPIVTVYGDKLPEGNEAIALALDACLAEAEAALDLLDFPDRDMQALAENVLRFGMPREYEKIMKKETSPDARPL